MSGFRPDAVNRCGGDLARTDEHGRTAEGQPGGLVRNVRVMEERGYTGWNTLYEHRLDYKTREHDAIVVGTEVNHSKLDDRGTVGGVTWHGAFVGAVASWARSGGDVIVRGESSSLSRPIWLDPLSSGIDNQLAGALQPGEEIESEVGHSLLHEPHTVYLTRVNPRQYAFVPASSTGWETILTGKYDHGNVPLTSWRP